MDQEINVLSWLECETSGIGTKKVVEVIVNSLQTMKYWTHLFQHQVFDNNAQRIPLYSGNCYKQNSLNKPEEYREPYHKFWIF